MLNHYPQRTSNKQQLKHFQSIFKSVFVRILLFDQSLMQMMIHLMSLMMKF
jgi:hypothetical protein